jgi:phage gpG-like protein
MNVTQPIDRTRELFDAITNLTKMEVLVGVPDDKTGRQEGAITNASLAYIHEFGSPARNIPARPFMYPGIRKAKSKIVAVMKRGAQRAIKNYDVEEAEAILNVVGLIAQKAIVREITDPDPPFAPLQPATIRGRLRRTAAGRRKLKAIKAGGKQLGMSMSDILTSYAQASWDTGSGMNIKPLIDTGQLRASITYVVRKR